MEVTKKFTPGTENPDLRLLYRKELEKLRVSIDFDHGTLPEIVAALCGFSVFLRLIPGFFLELSETARARPIR